MSEISRPEQLPFNHPHVQEWLLESTKQVFETGLVRKFVDSRVRLIGLRDVPPLKDCRPHGDEQTVALMGIAISAEAPLVAHRSIGQYETKEESLYLVKVDSDGFVLGGSLASIATLDHETQTPLKLEPGFTTEDIVIIQDLLKTQDKLPWHPVLDDQRYRAS